MLFMLRQWQKVDFFPQSNLPFSFRNRSQIFGWGIAVQLKDDISWSYLQLMGLDD